MRCEHCCIELNILTNNCPLCGKHLMAGESDRAYPTAKDIKVKGSRATRLLLFLTIVSSIALFTVNILTYPGYLWSVIPISAVWLAFLGIGVPIARRRITPLMMVLDNVIVSIFLVIVDVTTGYRGWAMSYVVPFVLFGSSLIITVVVICTRMTWRKFYLFQTAIVAICFIPIIARMFFDFVFWPSLVSAMYGGITIIGMVIFGDRGLKHEAKKRFHL